jgi:hypothetical protein
LYIVDSHNKKKEKHETEGRKEHEKTMYHSPSENQVPQKQ